MILSLNWLYVKTNKRTKSQLINGLESAVSLNGHSNVKLTFKPNSFVHGGNSHMDNYSFVFFKSSVVVVKYSIPTEKYIKYLCTLNEKVYSCAAAAQ